MKSFSGVLHEFLEKFKKPVYYNRALPVTASVLPVDVIYFLESG